MLTIEERLKIFWASSPQNVRGIDTLHFVHPLLATTEFYWNEYDFNSYCTLEDGSQILAKPANFVKKEPNTNGITQSCTVAMDLTDRQDIFREKLEQVPENDRRKLNVIYRYYLSDTLDKIEASEVLLCTKIDFTVEGALLTLNTPRPNLTYCGEPYTPNEIPMLRAFQ